MESSSVMFNTIKRECVYWRKRAQQYHQESQDIQQEFEEFKEASKQLEEAKDLVLEQNGRIKNDLIMSLTTLGKENRQAKLKVASQTLDLMKLGMHVQDLRQERDSLKVKLNVMQQTCDDLMWENRAQTEVITVMNINLEKEYERNLVLQNKIDELNSMMKEIRDQTQKLYEVLQDENNDMMSSENPNANDITKEAKINMKSMENSSSSSFKCKIIGVFKSIKSACHKC